MIARTSLEAYNPAEQQPLKEQVYALILQCNMLSNRDIAVILGRDNGTISARTNELCAEGRISSWTKKKDALTNKFVQVWEAIA